MWLRVVAIGLLVAAGALPLISPVAAQRPSRGEVTYADVRLGPELGYIRPYLEEIRRRIGEKSMYPCAMNETTLMCEYKNAMLVLEFSIDRSGRVPFIRVVRSSGYRVYDEHAVAAVNAATPFPPIPAAYTHARLPLVLNFRYAVGDTTAP